MKKLPLSRLLVPMALPILLLGCGPRSGPVHPEEMSAAEHRREAAREESRAGEHERSYMEATAAPAGPALAVDPASDRPVGASGDYDPREWHLWEADRHRHHAAAHRTAAASLERFEESECADFEPAVRASCPLLGPIERIDEVPRGVRLTFAAEAPAMEVVAHMRCHVAFARARAWPKETECSLYLRGVMVAPSPDHRGVDLTADDPAIRKKIRERAQALYGTPAK